jgi:Spy/CpxP family protein refolding chaperone
MKTTTPRLALLVPLAVLAVPALQSATSDSTAPESPPAAIRDTARPKRDRAHSVAPAENYTLAQATSDNAQLHTIAFNGLAFLTGDFGASTFIPPGKVCDFFGFQYMRDIDTAAKGHNPVFLNRVAGNVLQTLTSEQKGWFAALAAEQVPQLEALAEMRLPLIQAFHRNADDKLPAGSTGLNRAAVVNHVGKIFALDAELSLRRAEVMGKVATSLTAEQKAYFSKMKFGDFTTWPEVDADTIKDRPGRGQPKLFGVACMTYASEFFSWYAGSEAADVYFCPERHGTYFGGFYMKDMPAMGKKNYDISTSVTGDSGEAFVDEVLTPTQRKVVTATVEQQRAALQEVVSVRTAISRELRKALAGGQPDRAKVIALGRRYGELDGEMSWYYATAFATVNKTLTADQRAALVKLRNLDGYVSAPYYLYSDPVKTPKPVTGSDALFFPPKP